MPLLTRKNRHIGAGPLSGPPGPRQGDNCIGHFLSSHQQIFEKPVINIQFTLVFTEITDFVSLGQYAPDFRTETERETI